MRGNVYSDLKAAWHLDRITELRKGKQIVPVEIQFVISDLCNHDCHFCAYRASDGLSAEQFVVMEEDGTRNRNPKRMIAHEKASEILKDAAMLGVQSIIFTGGGEPTVHPHHLELFQEALDLGLQCSLNTNGNTLRRGWETVLPRFAYVRFSIDGGTPEEYAQIRGVSVKTYPKVMENLAKLAGEVYRQGSPCIVGTGYVVTPENWINLREGIANIKATGATYARLASMQSKVGKAPYGDNYRAVADLCSEVAAEFSDDSFTVVDLFDERQGDRPDYTFCGMQQYVTYIGANLKIYRCCYNAYTDFGEIGDLTNKRFAEWMLSFEKKDLIEHFDARSCDTCPLSAKNRTINYMRDPAPTHVSFV